MASFNKLIDHNKHMSILLFGVMAVLFAFFGASLGAYWGGDWLTGVIIAVAVAGLYFFMTDVSVAFFVLSAMTATLYLVMYILMYAAAIRLRLTRPDLPRSYRIPGGTPGMCAVAGLGLAGVVFSLVVGFFPPSNLPVGNPAVYVGLVSGGLVVFVGMPLLIHALKKPEWKQSGKA